MGTYGKLALSFVLLQLVGCTLPSIHRASQQAEQAQQAQQAEQSGQLSAAGGDAAVSDSGGPPAAAPEEDEDAGEAYDPLQDPANRGEALAITLTLLPKAHRFAEWSMPDTAAQAKVRPSYTVSDEVVTDNVTKLRWQRHLPDTYPGCKGHYTYVERDRGEGSGCTWEEAAAYCASPERAAQLGPGSWRVPTKIELESLIDPSRSHAVNPLFDGFPLDFVWTSTPYLNPRPNGLKLAWNIDLNSGESNIGARFKGGRVRCVSSSSSESGGAPEYELTRDFVRDKRTQLVWQRVPDSATRTWQQALAYCEQLEADGGGWRLPSLNELLTIVDPRTRDPAVDVRAFPLTKNERYWTATEFLDGEASAYQVDLSDGSGWAKGTFTDQHFARCVR